MTTMQWFTLLLPTALTILVGIIGFVLKNSINILFKRFDSFDITLNKMKTDFTQMREKLITEYLTKEDYKENKESHKELRQDITEMKEELAVAKNEIKNLKANEG